MSDDHESPHVPATAEPSESSAAVPGDDVHEIEVPQDRIAGRAQLNPSEEQAGSDDPTRQAEVILEEGDERAAEREDDPMTSGERRTSDEAT